MWKAECIGAMGLDFSIWVFLVFGVIFETDLVLDKSVAFGWCFWILKTINGLGYFDFAQLRSKTILRVSDVSEEPFRQ